MVKPELFFSAHIDNPPALEGQTSTEIIANHLNAMHAARAAFIKSETSKKRRRAIRAKTRTASSLICEPGDIVYLSEKTVTSGRDQAL